MISNGELNFRHTNLLDVRLIWQEVSVENFTSYTFKGDLKDGKIKLSRKKKR